MGEQVTQGSKRRQVFISYARESMAFVDRLSASLQTAGVEVWVDKHGLKPGTEIWEQGIRDAIRASFAVLLVASPPALQSRYVLGELKVADIYQRQVIPIWVAGQEYAESVPLDMIVTQYIDARQENQFNEAVEAVLKRLQEIRAAISEISSGEILLEDDSFTPRNPYKGLLAFTGEDAGDFFGRDTLVNELMTGIQPDTDTRFMAVIGPSGSGKSSLVMAGLLPRLKNGTQPGSHQWTLLNPVKPGAYPLESLAIALADALDSSVSRVLEDLRAGTRGLALQLRRLARRPETRILLLVDQFEELFIQTEDPDERDQFIDLLVTAATEPRGPGFVLITMRADFYDRPMNYDRLGKLMEVYSRSVLQMSIDELRAVVQNPAGLPDVGLEFEEGLVGDLLYEVQGQAGALPLLQFTLRQLVEEREGRLLTRDAYQSLGGVKGALARHAEATYERLPSEQHRELARDVFLRLIEPGETDLDTARRRAHMTELISADPTQNRVLQEVVNRFVEERLLTTGLAGTSPTLEVSHEALIREWHRLAEWVRLSRDDIRLGRQIGSATREWITRGRDADKLLHGAEIGEALDWAARNRASVEETEFINASLADAETRAEEERQRQQREHEMQVRLVLLEAEAREQKLREEAEAARLAARERELAYQKVAARRLRLVLTFLAIAVIIVLGLLGLASSEGGRAQSQADTAVAALRTATIAQGLADFARATSEANAATAQAAQVDAVNAASTALILQNEAQAARATSEANAFLAAAAENRALDQAGTAIAAQATSDRSVLEVQSLSLAAAAQQVLEDGSPALALLLAQQAVNIPTPPPEALAALADAAYAPGPRRQFEWPEDTGALRSQTVVYSPDGDRVLTGSCAGVNDAGSCIRGLALVWDVESGQVIYHLEGHEDGIFSAAFSPDGNFAVTGGADGSILLWDMATGDLMESFEQGHFAAVSSLDYSPDGRTVLSGSWDTTLRLWDAATGKSLREYRQHLREVNSVAFSPDGQSALSGSGDGTMIHWNLKTGQPIHIFDSAEAAAIPPGGRTVVREVAFAPDGNRAVYAVNEAAILVDLPSATNVRTFVRPGRTDVVNTLAFGPGGRELITGSCQLSDDDFSICIHGEVGVWDAETGVLIRQLEGHDGAVDSLALSPDGRQLVTGGLDDRVILWDFVPGPALRRFQRYEAGAFKLAYSADGSRIAVGGCTQFGSGSHCAHGDVHIWDTDTWRTRMLEAHESLVTSVALSPDGRWLLTGGCAVFEADLCVQGEIAVWDAETGEEIVRKPVHTGSVWSVNFNPAGTLALSAGCGRLFDNGNCRQGEVVLWNTADWSEANRLHGHFSYIYAAAFSPDGQRLLSGGVDGNLILWNVASGLPSRGYYLPGESVVSLAFTPDGTAFVVGSENSRLMLINLADGAIRREFVGHSSWIGGVAVSPDGSILFSGSGDDTATLWDIETGEQIQTFTDHTSAVRDVAFSPDGRRVITASYDGSLMLWSVNRSAEDLADYIASNRLILRDLTCDERGRYPALGACQPDVVLVSTGEAAETGGAITAGEVVTGDLPVNGRQAWLFEGRQGQVISVSMFVDDPDVLDPFLELYAPDGSLIEENDDIVLGQQRNALLPRIELPVDGTYTIIASAFYDDDSGLYSLLVNDLELVTPTATPTVVASPTATPTPPPAFSGSLQIGEPAMATIAPGELHVWTFEGAAGQVLSFSITAATEAGVDTQIMLYRTTFPGELFYLDDSRFYRPGPTSLTRLIPRITLSSSGTYSVHVWHNNITAESYSYTLSVIDLMVTTPTPSLTPTLTPSVTLTPTPTLTSTPANLNAVRRARPGRNAGEVPLNGAQVWSYEAQSGEIITLEVQAANPANSATPDEQRDQNLLDTVIVLRSPDGTIIAQHDDIQSFFNTNSEIRSFYLNSAGRYTIEVRGFAALTGGDYTLTIGSIPPPAPTPTFIPFEPIGASDIQLTATAIIARATQLAELARTPQAPFASATPSRTPTVSHMATVTATMSLTPTATPTGSP